MPGGSSGPSPEEVAAPSSPARGTEAADGGGEEPETIPGITEDQQVALEDGQGEPQDMAQLSPPPPTPEPADQPDLQPEVAPDTPSVSGAPPAAVPPGTPSVSEAPPAAVPPDTPSVSGAPPPATPNVEHETGSLQPSRDTKRKLSLEESHFFTESVPPEILSDAAIRSRIRRVFLKKHNGTTALDDRWNNMWADTSGGGREKVMAMFEKCGYNVERCVEMSSIILTFSWMFHCDPTGSYA